MNLNLGLAFHLVVEFLGSNVYVLFLFADFLINSLPGFSFRLVHLDGLLLWKISLLLLQVLFHILILQVLVDIVYRRSLVPALVLTLLIPCTKQGLLLPLLLLRELLWFKKWLVRVFVRLSCELHLRCPDQGCTTLLNLC